MIPDTIITTTSGNNISNTNTNCSNTAKNIKITKARKFHVVLTKNQKKE